MDRWHLYFMGLLGAGLGVVLTADYVMAQYEIPAYLALFTPEQQAWFAAMPAWLDGVWGAQAVLALFGGFSLLFGARSAVWSLGFAFILNIVLTAGLLGIVSPPMQSVTGWIGIAVMLASVALSLLLWLYARGEKQRYDGVL